MKDKTIRYGIIGCGGIAHTHAQALQKVKNAKLTGVCGSTPESADSFADKYNIENLKNALNLIQSPDIDAVIICTPSGLHAQDAIAAANHKKHALIEKPLALNVNDCIDVINAFKNNKVIASVVSQLRFAPDIIKAKQLISSGRLGQITMANLTMRYFRDQSYYDSASWRGTWELDGGGALMNQGVHGVDIMLYLAGHVKNVHGYATTLTHDIEVEDNVVAIAEFESGALATVIATTSSVPARNKTVEVYGTKGMLVVEEDVIKTLYLEHGEKYTINDINDSDSTTSHLIGDKGHLLQLESFTKSLLTGSEPVVTLQDGMRAVEFITNVYKSSNNDRI